MVGYGASKSINWRVDAANRMQKDNGHTMEPAGSPRNTPNVIVICGSMSHFESMLRLKQELTARNIEAVAPEDERHLAHTSISDATYSQLKRRMSEDYFRVIRRRNVYGILVVNHSKHGKDNYIGPNTFAEIAIAVNAKKKVFLLEDLYSELRDELHSWGAIPLRGNLDILNQLLVESIVHAQLQLDFPFQNSPSGELKED